MSKYEWQTRWLSSEKGIWMHILTPDATVWIDCGHGNLIETHLDLESQLIMTISAVRIEIRMKDTLSVTKLNDLRYNFLINRVTK